MGEKTGKTILLVDDAEVFRRLEEGLLRTYGYRFLHAADGAQAIKLATSELPDLVLLDVQMPVMDGVQVLRHLKSQASTAEIPIVIITTIGRDEDRELFLRAGANAALSKPINARTLVTTVRQQLGEA
jgi:CheY-like chemotaxis protein